MSKYGYSVYGASRYGLTPKLAYSVEPMGINVIKFYEVLVSWQSPTGNFTRFRVVRNQNAYPETAEDGIIIYEVMSEDGLTLEGKITRSSFYDGLENPTQTAINTGRNIFYRVFLYTSDNVWVKAGEISEVIPENTGATNKVLDLLPRVLTSSDLSPLGVVSEDSQLYKFLDALAFSYEQMMTEIKLARPAHNLESSNYKTIPGETLNLGLTPEPNLPMLRQRALIREAIPLYADKGTATGIADYVESLTGFAPTLTTSSNLMLSVQDSTFYKDTGSWSANTATLLTTTEMVPPTNDYAIDTEYTCKVTSVGVATMSLGNNAPITMGIPVLPSTPYDFSCYIKSPTSAGNVTITINYYNKDGVQVGTLSSGSPNSATNAWSRIELEYGAPSDASYMGIILTFSASGVYYVDMCSVIKGIALNNYEEARVTTINLAPKLENYVVNPSFEVNASEWTLTGLTFSQDTDVPLAGYAGSYSGKFVASGNWSLSSNSMFPVESGIYFNVSHYMKSADMMQMTAFIDLYDSSNVLIDTVSDTHMLTNMWMRGYISALIPSGSTATYAKYRLEGTAGTLYLDMVMAQDTFAPSDYFDGSMPELVGAIWQGTPHASTSLYYPNKSTKILRLAQTLNEWVPMNAWWRITTPAGLEYTNLDV